MSKTRKIREINEEDLITIKECHLRLGRGFSRSTILRRIASGEFEEGWHWVNLASRNSQNRNIRINMAAIREYIATPGGLR